MNDYQQWRSWAAGLDDASFARVWRALGVVAAQRPTSGAPIEWLKRVWSNSLREQELRWSLPRFDDSASAILQNFTPINWLDDWGAVIADRLDKAPLRIEAWPKDEPGSEWFVVLNRLSPVATLKLESSRTHKPEWPVRLAALHAQGQDAVKQAIGLWPSNRLARSVGEHAQCFACDVLVLDGDLDAVLPQLEGGAVSAHHVVLCQQRPWAAGDFEKLDTLVKSTSAGGIVAIESSQGIDLPGRLNRLVEELSHARRVDVATSLAFAGSPHPAVIAISDTLARFTILEVAGQLLRRSRTLRDQGSPSAAVRDLLDQAISRVPPPTSAEPESSGLEAVGAEPVASARGLEGLGGDEAMASPGESAGDALESMSGDIEESDEGLVPDFERLEAPYDRESGAATGLAEAAAELDRAEATLSSDRYLQQKAFVESGGQRTPAVTGFVVGQAAVLEVFIGPPDREANAMPDVFPEAALPQELDSWDLRVWLSEPDYLPQPLRGDIVLRRIGTTKKCEFKFTPEHPGMFNGRISVLHRGRVIQTAALRASVHLADEAPAQAIAPTLDRVLQVRQNLSNLDRRPFDLALVLNHAGVDQPTAQAMGANRAWLANLRVVEKTVADLNMLLSGLARTAKDYIGGLDSDKGKILLRKLAQVGSYLHLYLVESQGLAAGNPAGDDVLKGEFIQVVSTRSDAIVIPFEFIYEYDAPDDDAMPCPKWREAVSAGRCPATCKHDSKTYCPMGFWGMSKVIERHALQAGLASEGEVGVQSTAVGSRDTLRISGNAVLGFSQKVKEADLAPLLQRMTAAQLTANQARDWKEWAILVGKHSPSLLIALAHSDGAGFGATVEIGGQAIKTIGITAGHIRASAEAGERPLVALLGCDMAGTGDNYSNPVAVFTMRGAAAVIGTIATVLADDAADVAARIMQGLTFVDPAQTRRIGEALRDLKRNALLDGELMPMCLVGFGDADWLLSN